MGEPFIMSEKKVLKNMLGKLKVKTINSEIELLESFASLYEQMSEVWKTLSALRKEKAGSEEVFEMVGFDMRGVGSFVDVSISCSRRTLEDFKLYIESLEQYSSGLDETLNDIFQQAEKIAGEQRKKQEEMKKKKPKYTV